MISVKQAQGKVLESKIKPVAAKVHIIDSLGFVLAEDIVSRDNIPIYDNSAMDGFAVRVQDVKGAENNYPVKLALTQEDIPAGKLPKEKINPGYCTPIMTGAPIPKGSDAVIMKEDTQREEKSVLVFKECRVGENIRLEGEDIRKDDLVLNKGRIIYPADIGVMASLGFDEILVNSAPSVGIIATGDELLEVPEDLKMGMVRDSNSYSLSAQVKEMGIGYIRYGIIQDDLKSLEKNIKSALAENDILLLSGGVSEGDYDFVKDSLKNIGAKQIFWKVNQKPGKPIAFYGYKDKFIFGLPGNPVSVMVCFEIYVRPLIRKIMGYKNLFRPVIHAKASHDFKNKNGRTNFVRVVLEKKDGQYFFNSTGLQGSGILTSMIKADGIAVFPEDTGDIKKDSIIEIFLLKEYNK